MPILDDLKQKWDVEKPASEDAAPYDAATLNHIIQTRMKKHNNMIFRYFWATFTLQIMVYALLSHVIIRYGADTNTLLLSLLGFGVTVPFTVIMLKRYKQMAANRPDGTSEASIYSYVKQQRNWLTSFYSFKIRYELMLIPLLSAIGVILVFNLFFPGGVLAFPMAAIITYLLTLLSCFLAIRDENKRYFIRPLQELQGILEDYKM
jgi:hypothetical protein